MLRQKPSTKTQETHNFEDYDDEVTFIVQLLNQTELFNLTDEPTVQLMLASMPVIAKRSLARTPLCKPDILRFLSFDTDFSVISSLATNPACPKDIMEKIYETNALVLQKILLSNVNLPAHLIFSFASNTNPQLRTATANRIFLDAKTAETLKDDLAVNVRITLAGNNQTPQHILLHYAQTDIHPVILAVAVNKKSSTHTLKQVLARIPDSVYNVDVYALKVAENRNLSYAIAKTLSTHVNVQVRKKLAGNEVISPKILASLTNYDVEVRKVLATNITLYIKTLDELAKDSDVTVRVNVALNWKVRQVIRIRGRIKR